MENILVVLLWHLCAQRTSIWCTPFDCALCVSCTFESYQVITQSIGAAFAVAATSVPAWSAGFQGGGNVGGLMEAVFQPLGNFGKFLTVIMSLSVAPNLVSILYSASLNYQIIVPQLFVVPRYIFTILTAAMCVLSAFF